MRDTALAGRDSGQEILLAHTRVEHDRLALLDRKRVSAPVEIQGRQPAHRPGIDQLGDGDVQRAALDTIGIVGGDPESLPRVARDHLGSVAGETLVVTLWQRADPRREQFGVAEPSSELDEPCRARDHQPGDDLLDLPQAREIVVLERYADHDTPPLLTGPGPWLAGATAPVSVPPASAARWLVVPSTVRIFSAPAAIERDWSSWIHVRISAGES